MLQLQDSHVLLPNLASSANFRCTFVIDLDAARKRLRPQHLEPPHIVQMLAQAEHFQRLIDSGEVASRADLARTLGLTRARVTQILNLLNLHPLLLLAIRELPVTAPRRWVTEKKLRGLCRLPLGEQLERAAQVVPGLERGRQERNAG